MRIIHIVWGCLALGITVGATNPTAQTDDAQETNIIQESNAVMKPATAPTTLAWADVLEQNPDPNVVTDADLLNRIIETKLPWRVKDKGTGIEMLLVPPGKFMMGMSSPDSDAQENEKPSHQVTLTKPFYLGRTEVTQPQWVAAMGENPSICKVANPNDAMVDMLMKNGLTKEQAEAKAASASMSMNILPVDTISWADSQKFCYKTGFQLPTEAQWEYACRAGDNNPRYGELSEIAWNPENANKTSHSVASKTPNALGFYDMLGNIWEWTGDWYEGSYYKTCEKGVVDPNGPAQKSSSTAITGRVLRGGGWVGFPYGCRASYRYGYDPDHRYYFIGFRVARNP